MPQMAPLSWTILFMFFIMLFMIMNTMNYYMTAPKITPPQGAFYSSKFLNWKW